jgi:hypothetical protein
MNVRVPWNQSGRTAISSGRYSCKFGSFDDLVTQLSSRMILLV